MMLVVRRRAVVVLVVLVVVGWGRLFWKIVVVVMVMPVVARAGRRGRAIVAWMGVVVVRAGAFDAFLRRVASHLMGPRHGVGQREADQHGEEEQ